MQENVFSPLPKSNSRYRKGWCRKFRRCRKIYPVLTQVMSKVQEVLYSHQGSQLSGAGSLEGGYG